MREFNVRFTKYANGERIVSGPTFLHADDFDGAVHDANLILQGMRRTDGNTDFEVAEITSTGLMGKRSDDMCDIWNVGPEE